MKSACHLSINTSPYDERVSEFSNIDELFDLYETKGSRHYGEGVTQLDHALQCAALARADGVHDEVMVAALFHDIGHLAADVQDNQDFDISHDDDHHEALGARILAPLFGPAVARPVALHVMAKRWLCTREPGYRDRLSAASQATLIAQGGQLSNEECDRFEEHPGFNDAVALRSWDDAGKREGVRVGHLRDWEPLVRSLALPQ
jgi:[1-hydroxy-2-(trimethylamino)ethyl]phosphonate dioxygenase